MKKLTEEETTIDVIIKHFVHETAGEKGVSEGGGEGKFPCTHPRKEIIGRMVRKHHFYVFAIIFLIIIFQGKYLTDLSLNFLRLSFLPQLSVFQQDNT
jgi:hypothetical protein